MLRFAFMFLLLSSCANLEQGGDRKFEYDADRDYSLLQLQELSGGMVSTLRRDPPFGTLDKLFGSGQKPLKRIGILIFESSLQPTPGGLAGEDLIYLSAAGKQLMTEKLLTIWEQGAFLAMPDVEFFPISQIRESKAASVYGVAVEDYINSPRQTLAPDDIFYLDKGRGIQSPLIINPRGMRDLSFLLVPATELMKGPKWSEHNKHFINDVFKDLRLDGALLIMSEISWTRGRMDKNTGEHLAEQLRLNIHTSLVTSLSDYQERLKKLSLKNDSSVTVNFRTYHSEVVLPLKIAVPQNERSFELIEHELIKPLFKVYRDMSVMVMNSINQDVKSTGR